MYDYVYGVYETVAESTQSELILFFVVAGAVSVPLYLAVSRAKKQERQCQRERDAQLMDVLRSNTEAITKLAVITNDHVEQSRAALNRIHDRLDNNAHMPHTGRKPAKKGNIPPRDPPLPLP